MDTWALLPFPFTLFYLICLLGVKVFLVSLLWPSPLSCVRPDPFISSFLILRLEKPSPQPSSASHCSFWTLCLFSFQRVLLLVVFHPLYPPLSPLPFRFLIFFFSCDVCIFFPPCSYFCCSWIKLVISWLPLSLVESRLVLPSHEGGTLSVLVDWCNPPTRDKGHHLHYSSHLWSGISPLMRTIS